MANTCKAATNSGSMILNELRSPMILASNSINSAAMDKMLMGHLKGIRTLMKENVKLQIVVIENERLKNVAAKLEMS